MNSFKTPFQGFVYARTYSRWKDEEGRRENWDETVKRYVDYMVLKLEDKITAKEAKDAFNAIYKLEVMPSMRGLWAAGPAIDADNLALFNCSFVTITKLKRFSELLYILMNGTGAGFSVERVFTNELPTIKELDASARKEEIQFADSKIGWAEGFEKVIYCLWNGIPFECDYSLVRPKGARLKTFGGRASGPDPLKDLITFTTTIVERNRGTQLQPIDVHDICCKIAEVVVVGGVRRSALLSLSDLTDNQIANAKVGEFWNESPQRVLANNSVAYTRKPDIISFMDEWKHLIRSKAGERGIFSRVAAIKKAGENSRRDATKVVGTNPCLPKYVKIIKKDFGLIELEKLQIGDEIWSKEGWTKVINKWSSGIKDVFEYNVNGMSLFCTENHKIVSNGNKIEAKNAKQFDIFSINLKDYINDKDDYKKNLTKTTQSFDILQNKYQETCEVFDITVDNLSHTFWCDGFNISNCAEILLRDMELCVAGNTALITKDGIFEIQEKENCKVDIWNGEKWSKVLVKRTRTNEELLRINFSDGTFLDCTYDHKFSVKTRFQKEWSKVEAKDLKKFSKYTLQIQPANFKINNNIGIKMLNPYTLGFAVGDGCVDKNRVRIDLYGDKDIKCPVLGKRSELRLKPGYNVACVNVIADVDINVVSKLKYSGENSFKEIASWSKETILQFTAGLADADGSMANNGIRIYISERQRAYHLQLALTKCGITSSLNLASKAGSITNKGIRKKDLWYLQIVNAKEIPCIRLNTSKGKNSKFKGKYQTIRNIEKLDGVYDTFCFTEKEKGMGVFGNVLTYQCNLTEVIVRPDDTFETLKNKIKIATMLGTWQSNFTNFNYIDKEWKENCDDERLLGVSMSGLRDHPVLGTVNDTAKKWLSDFKHIAIQTNKKYAEKLGIKRAAGITCIKPSGTVSSLVDCSPGAHVRQTKTGYYIRRIRISATDPLFRLMKDQGVKYACEVGQTPDSASTYVLEFATKAPDTARNRKNETAMEQLEYWKMLRNFYCEHNPSITISVKEEEWLDTAAWVYRNFDDVCGLSFLPSSDHIYQLAPYEDITEKEYDKIIAEEPKIDFSKLAEYEIEDNTEGAKEYACTAGSCELK